MAKKRPAKQGGSVSKRSRDSEDSPKVSRKVLRGASAPYERKDEEDDKGGKSQGGKVKAEAAKDDAADKNAAEKRADAPSLAKAEEPSRTKAGAPEADAASKASGKEASPLDAWPLASAGEDEKGAPSIVETTETAKAGGTKDADAGPGADPNGQGKSESPAAAGEQAPAPAAEPKASPAPPAETRAEPPADTEVAALLPPRFIDESWDAEAPAPPPGKAPPGDSRSLRRSREGVDEFVLIYRSRSFLITRAGRVGRQGKWTVVEYPTVGAAAHAYAQECSDLTAQGYRDLR